MGNPLVGYFSETELGEIGLGKVGVNVRIARSTQLLNADNIFIGDNVRIDNFCTIAPSSSAKLIIGSYVHICAYVFFNGLADIIIHDFCSIGNFCQFFSSMDDFSGNFLTGAVVPRELIGTISNKIVIKKHTIVAPSCIILPGVTLNSGTAIGAHSLVKESTKGFSIYGGVPARYIKARSRNLLNLEKKIK